MKLKTNLHFHTADDPNHEIEYSFYQAIDKTSALGFSVLALTCHNYFAWSKKYAEYAEEKGILLIPGIEIGINRGKVSKEGRHLIILGCDKDVEKIQTFDDVRKYKKKHPEIFILAPHPFFYGSFSLKDALEKNIDIIDAIEQSWFYSKWFNKNKEAEKMAKKYNLPYISTSDTHFFNFIDRHYATITTKEQTQEAVFESMRKKQFKNTTSPQNFLLDLMIIQGIFTISDNIKRFAKKFSKKPAANLDFSE